MTLSLADVFAQIQAGPPAPFILIDTCSFLDLFRTDESQTKVPYQPRALHQEIQQAAGLLGLVNATPEAAHLTSQPQEKVWANDGLRVFATEFCAPALRPGRLPQGRA